MLFNEALESFFLHSTDLPLEGFSKAGYQEKTFYSLPMPHIIDLRFLSQGYHSCAINRR